MEQIEKVNDIINNIKNIVRIEMESFMDAVKNIEVLVPKAESREEKEVVNSYIDIAQNHYDTFYDALNNGIEIINELNKKAHEEMREISEPGAQIVPPELMKLFEQKIKLNKLIIDDDE